MHKTKWTSSQNQWEETNIYAPNNGVFMYIKQPPLNIKNQIDYNTKILGDFNTPLSSLDRSSNQKLNEDATERKIQSIIWA